MIKMSDELNCYNCRYFKEYNTFSFCRRYPPNIKGKYPSVESDDFCGEHSELRGHSNKTPHYLTEDDVLPPPVKNI